MGRHLLATGVGELQVAGPVVSIKMDSILSCAVVPLALLGVIAATIRVYFGRCFPGLMMLGSKGEPLIEPMPELDVSIRELLATTDVVVFFEKHLSQLRQSGQCPARRRYQATYCHSAPHHEGGAQRADGWPRLRAQGLCQRHFYRRLQRWRHGRVPSAPRRWHHPTHAR